MTATMSPVEALREFLDRRLSAAAAEIFSMFLPTLVQYQEQIQIQIQQRLQQVSRRETTKTQRTDDPQPYLCIEEQLRNKQQHPNFEQEEPELPQIKEEQEGPEPPQIKDEQEGPEPPQIKDEQEGPEPPQIKEEFRVVNREADDIMVTVIDGQSDCRENLNFERGFISQRLTAAAEEILCMFQQTISQYQEEIHAQLEITLHPQIKLHRIDDPEQQMNYSLQEMESEGPEMKEQQEPESPLIKKEQEELSLSASMKNHMGEKEHFCETCVKKFNSKNNFLVHMRIHTGEKLHSCVTCGRNFLYPCDLVRHVRIHTGEKPHLCVTCGKGFSLKKNLCRHMRIHTGEKPYSCDSCGISFTDRSALLRHVRIHTGEKPFSCVICGKCFNRNSNLALHMRIHSRDKPFSCETCVKSFADPTVFFASHENPHWDKATRLRQLQN